MACGLEGTHPCSWGDGPLGDMGFVELDATLQG